MSSREDLRTAKRILIEDAAKRATHLRQSGAGLRSVVRAAGSALLANSLAED
jgi:hypothetical protein